MERLARLALAAALGCMPAMAAATVFNPVPEPGALELLAAGAVAAAIVWARNRRK